jgi:predicted PurR-regulated permease PerM
MPVYAVGGQSANGSVGTVQCVLRRFTHMPDSPKERFQQLLFYALVLLMAYLAVLVLGPFLAPLAWAAVFAMMFYGVHKELQPKIGASNAALSTTVMAGILIVAPAVTLVSVFAREVPPLIDYLKSADLTSPDRIEQTWQVVRRNSPMALPEDPTALLREGVQRALAFLAPRAGAVVADAFATLGSLFVMLFSLFFLLRDGDTIGKQIRELLPLPERERERLVVETRDLVIASVGAGLLVAAVQGAIGGLAFWAVGIGAPVVWGVVMAMCALIPLVGAALVWVPAALWLLLSGEITRGIILAIVGVLFISMADNVLRPLLLAGRTSASGLVVFLGLLGGAAAFGFIGLVVGPIILVTAGNLIRVFTRPELVETAQPLVVPANPK